MRDQRPGNEEGTKVRWCVVANQSKARIYRQTSKDFNPMLIQEVLHPKGRLQNREIDSDAPGRSFQSWSGTEKRHALSTEESTHQHESKKFAAEIDELLKKGRVEHSFDELILMAEPRFLGMMLSELDQPTKRLLVEQVQKDIVQMTDHQIIQNIKEIH
ncbi:MAG: host attachment protein [Oligoflexales bacterium]